MPPGGPTDGQDRQFETTAAEDLHRRLQARCRAARHGAALLDRGGRQSRRRQRPDERRVDGEVAPPIPECGPDAAVDELRDENKRLKAALKRAELEREILKKATAFFARESP